MKCVIARILAILLLSVGSVSCGVEERFADTKLEQDSIESELSEPSDVLEKLGYRVRITEVEQLGADFKPNGKTTDLLTMSANQFLTIHVGKEREKPGGGITLYNSATMQPLLNASDANGDGRLDLLAYTVLDESGNWVTEVFDYGADGIADMRVHAHEDYFEVWYRDRWYKVGKLDEPKGITVDGRFIELEEDANRWKVPELELKVGSD